VTEHFAVTGIFNYIAGEGIRFDTGYACNDSVNRGLLRPLHNTIDFNLNIASGLPRQTVRVRSLL
jgi:hypothetical protein